MPILQELGPKEISQVLLGAADRSVPVTLTVRGGDHWVTLQSRLVGLRNHRLLLEVPMGGRGNLHEFQPAEELGVSLKLKHHKYLFLAPVVAVEAFDADATQSAGPDEPLLVLARPARMQRLQRRAFVRADVPSGVVVRAAFWLGGREAEPAGATPDRPVWSGRVTNLSAGGFSLRTSDESVRLVEPGYVVGVRLLFGAAQEAVFADACVRHIAPDEEGAVVGLQFVGLEHSEEGLRVLRTIGRKVLDYQALAPSRMDRRNGDEEDSTAAGQVAGRSRSLESLRGSL